MNAKTSREAELAEQVTELLAQRAAISEVLHAIAGWPHELQPIFDAILVSATRLCRAVSGSFRLFEDKGLRLVAWKGAELLQQWPLPTLLDYSSGYGLPAANKSPIHASDAAAHELYRQGDPHIVALVEKAGLRTLLLAPLLTDEVVIGVITLVVIVWSLLPTDRLTWWSTSLRRQVLPWRAPVESVSIGTCSRNWRTRIGSPPSVSSRRRLVMSSGSHLLPS